MTMSADSIDPGLVTELHAKIEALSNLCESWERRAETALRLAEAHGKELASLRATLAVEPDPDPGHPDREERSSAYWFASWREVQRLRAEDKLRLRALDRELEELRAERRG